MLGSYFSTGFNDANLLVRRSIMLSLVTSLGLGVRLRLTAPVDGGGTGVGVDILDVITAASNFSE